MWAFWNNDIMLLLPWQSDPVEAMYRVRRKICRLVNFDFIVKKKKKKHAAVCHSEIAAAKRILIFVVAANATNVVIFFFFFFILCYFIVQIDFRTRKTRTPAGTELVLKLQRLPRKCYARNYHAAVASSTTEVFSRILIIDEKRKTQKKKKQNRPMCIEFCVFCFFFFFT